MNWIKVTNETKVPTDIPVLIKATATGKTLKGMIIPDTNSIFEVDHSETTYLKAEYSHYCIITEPNDPKQLIEDLKVIMYKLKSAFTRDSEQEMKCLRIESNITSLERLLKDD